MKSGMIRCVCWMLCAVTLAPAVALAGATAVDVVALGDVALGPKGKVYGPFSNAPGTDKDFSISGTANMGAGGGDVTVRYMWDPRSATNGNIKGYTQVSQWFSAGTNLPAGAQAISTPTARLAGACPQWVYLEVRSTQNILAAGSSVSYTHTCNVGGPIPPGGSITATAREPISSTLGLLILALVIATTGFVVLTRSKRRESGSAMA